MARGNEMVQCRRGRGVRGVWGPGWRCGGGAGLGGCGAHEPEKVGAAPLSVEHVGVPDLGEELVHLRGGGAKRMDADCSEALYRAILLLRRVTPRALILHLRDGEAEQHDEVDHVPPARRDGSDDGGRVELVPCVATHRAGRTDWPGLRRASLGR